MAGKKRGRVSRKQLAAQASLVSEIVSPLSDIIGFVVWLTGVIVSLTVGYSMVRNVLALSPFIPLAVTEVVGWVVIVLTVLGVVLKVIDTMR